MEAELVAGRRNKACLPKELYGIFLQKVNTIQYTHLVCMCDPLPVRIQMFYV